jgi:hypothetical protein
MPRASRSIAAPTYDDIARKAYDLYVLRGGQPGHEVADWLEAERLLATAETVVSEKLEVKKVKKAAAPKPRVAARTTPDTPSVKSRTRRKPSA